MTNDSEWRVRLDREHTARQTAERLLEEKIREAAALHRRMEALEAAKREYEDTIAQLTRALEAAVSGNQTKTHFLAAMSHELRTPLNAIIGFSEIIRGQLFGPLGNERYLSYAQNINDSGAHLLALINDILDISKCDAGRMELHEETVSLAKIIAACTTLTGPQAGKVKVRLTMHIDPALSDIRCDERRMRQILLNLLSNAVKFTPAGGDISVTARLRDDAIAIAVSDTGIGIAAHDVATAFERFGQIDSTLGRKYEGTGLGLPLARNLAELHGGSLSLESDVGVGTTVTLLLPLTRLEAAKKIA